MNSLEFYPERLNFVRFFKGRKRRGEFEAEMYRRCLRFWSNYWQDLLGSDRMQMMSPEEFFRQDCIALLYYEGAIAALHAYSFYDGRTPELFEHSYFRSQGMPQMLSLLQQQGLASHLMTLEYLSVNRDFSPLHTQFNFASLLFNLAVLAARDMDASCLLTIARSDVPSRLLLEECGGIVHETVELHNVSCDLVYIPRERLSFSKRIRDHHFAEVLWTNRHDC